MSALNFLLDRYGDKPTCNLHWIGRMLNHGGSTHKLEEYVTRLIAEEGFPKPMPHLKHGGGLSHDVSYRRSQWIRAGVLEWLGRYLPPGAVAQDDDRAREAAADEMDRAAGHLHLVASNG